MNPFEELLTQSSEPNVAPEVLEMLGRQASQLFQTKGTPLNKAITQVVTNHPGLSNEHVKRIVEFANTITFQDIFQDNDDKNVYFAIADPGTVIRDLRDGGSPSQSGITLNSDYHKSPQLGMDNTGLDASLMQQFTGSSPSMEESTKVASSHFIDHEKHANPLEDLHDNILRAQLVRDKLASSYEVMDLQLKSAEEDFYRIVKHQVLDVDGRGIGGVLGALEKVAAEDYVASVMSSVVNRLKKEGHAKDFLMGSLKKTAGIVPNLDHPLFSAFDAMIKLANELITCDRAISDVDDMLADLKSSFKKSAGDITTGVKGAMGVRGKVPNSVRQRFSRTQ